MFNRLLAAFAAFALCLPQPGLAQSGYYSSNYPKAYTIGPNRGGRLGLTFERNLYRCGTNMCAKVAGVARTNFSGIRPGDYIVLVNGISFSTFELLTGLVGENSPGTRIRIDYWEGANLSPMYQIAAVTSDSAFVDTARSSSLSQREALDSLARSVDEIIAADARYWDVYTYRKGSVGDVRVNYVSNQGRDYSISAAYLYDGMITTNNTGTVELRFRGNQIDCLKYWDRSSCRAPLTGSSGLVPALAAIAAVVVVASVAGQGSKPGYSPAPRSGQTRSQCLQTCSKYPGDSNPNVEASYLAQCRRNCSSLPDY